MKSRILNLVKKFTDDKITHEMVRQTLDQLATVDEASATFQISYKDGKVSGRVVSTATIPVTPWIEPIVKALEGVFGPEEE